MRDHSWRLSLVGHSMGLHTHSTRPVPSRRTAVLLLMIVFVPVLSAGDVPNYERVLIPVVADQSLGAYGSVWSSSLWIYNGTSNRLSFEEDVLETLIDCVSIPCAQPEPLEPFTAREIRIDSKIFGSDLPLRILLVKKEVAPHVKFNLRIRDLSRALTTFGTELPVVHDSDFLTGRSVFVPVPNDVNYRQSLRIYTRPGEPCSDFEVVFFAPETGAELNRVVLTTAGFGATCADYGFAVLHSFGALLPSGAKVFGVKVEPRRAETNYYALVSITSNITQHVTTITPDQP